MAKFINAHVVTYSPQHVLATVNELERLGYKHFFNKKENYQLVKCIYLFDDGDYCLGTGPFHSFYDNSHDRKLLTIELRGAHDPIKTDSRDRQSVLAVLGSKPISMPLTNSEVVALQEQFIADLQATVDTSPPQPVPSTVTPPMPLSLWAKGMAWVKAFTQRVIKHFK